MWVGIGVGIGRNRFATGIFSAYEARVIADGGITEAGQCVNAVSGILLNASLLLIPSGYKGGKLYAEIPTNGNGDLTWTRGSDAFRTNASGLIQRVPWNLLTYSETFTNAIWQKSGATITANTTNAPNGTTTASSLMETTATTIDHYIFNASVGSWNNSMTYSVYLKQNGRRYVQTATVTSQGVFRPVFDLQDGVYVGNVGTNTGATASIENVGNGWFRCIVVHPPITLNLSQVTVIMQNSATYQSYTGDTTKGVFIWGAQLVEGTTAQTYLPTTDRLNFPRLSYMYGSCPSALLEPQRTNLVTYSQEFDNSAWTKINATITANTTTSPDGTTNADTITDNSTSGSHFVRASTGWSTTQQTATVYAKAGTSSKVYIMNSSTGTGVFADLSNETLVVSSGFTGSLSNVGSGWYRITATHTASASQSLAIGLFTGTSTFSYSGTGSTAFIYGAQLEAGAYPTTYIPTTSATATRIADSFSRSNIYTNGLISASGGTWFVELKNNVAYTRDSSLVGLFLGDTSVGQTNSFAISCPTGNDRLRIGKFFGGYTQLFQTTTSTVKIAIKWNGTSADVFVNGVKQVSATAFTATALEFLAHSTSVDVPKFIQQMALFSTPLSDTDCATLTT